MIKPNLSFLPEYVSDIYMFLRVLGLAIRGIVYLADFFKKTFWGRGGINEMLNLGLT